MMKMIKQAEWHGIAKSECTLERILSKTKLWRRKNKTDVAAWWQILLKSFKVIISI